MAKQKKKSLIAKVRTRIAPSPTGYPHVGTAFQALFDWVYARRYDGQFLMRLEDTDQDRFVEDAEQVLYEAFEWLGIVPDESPRKGGPKAPYRQSERLDLYQKYAQQLIEQGDAYYCFCSQERLDQVRAEQKKRGIPPRYDRHCRDLSTAEVQKKLDNNQSYVIRMKVPDDETVVVKDELRGNVKFDSNTVDDQVLIKSDGFPTYHLAVVVDDHLMEITHLVRGEEWLPSAPKHVLLYRYFDWSMPDLIHTPTLRNPDKSKLSKRKGNTSLWWYREHGYLPQAILNFLGLLVWKPAENQEIFSLETMIDKFEWREMNVTGPVFDVKKLEWLNGKYLRQLDKQQLQTIVNNWIDWVLDNGEDDKVIAAAKQLHTWSKENQELFAPALALSHDRARTLVDLHHLLDFYFVDELAYDRFDLLQGHETGKIAQSLRLVKQRLADLSNYTSDSWETTIRDTADEQSLSHKDLFMALRAAVTAKKFTPPLYEVMEVLGHETSFNRIEQAAVYLLEQES